MMEELKNNNISDEANEDMFSNLLSSMGIENYDVLLPAALNEIASSKSSLQLVSFTLYINDWSNFLHQDSPLNYYPTPRIILYILHGRFLLQVLKYFSIISYAKITT